MDYRYGSHTVDQIEYHFVWVTKYRYKVLTAEVGQRVPDQDRERGGQWWPCTHIGECAAGVGAQRDHEEAQRAHSQQATGRVSASEEEVLGTSLVGAGYFLRRWVADERRDDQAVPGALF